MSKTADITIVGAGLAGTLMAILLARRGVSVRLIEARPDPRLHAPSAGRSINLALAQRGLHALETAGILPAIQPLLLPMQGRMLHETNGATHFIHYGQAAHEQIYSISRQDLNRTLLNCVAELPHARLYFEHSCTAVDCTQQQIILHDSLTQRTQLESFNALIGADGAGSTVREALIKHFPAVCQTNLLAHGYKELILPANAQQQHQLAPHALHIWPRDAFMLIALPNTDGSFTVTLFLPLEGPESFASLHDATSIYRFFAQHFPDALALMPKLTEEFLTHPTGKMGTVHCSCWTDGKACTLIGDAAHAVVPFHGQGMNCAFEDCILFDALLQRMDFASACQAFQAQRAIDTEAIADMALENYTEMRSTVRDQKFLLQKELSFELERRYPKQFIPRYSMVMFHHEISYSTAYQRGRIQAAILNELTREATSLRTVNFTAADELINKQLPPL